MGWFNFGTNVNNTVHETVNNTFNDFVKNTAITSSSEISCDQAIKVGDITACPDFTISQICNLKVNSYQSLSDTTVTTVLSQLTSNILDNISQEASKQAGGLFGLIDGALPGANFQTNVTNTKDAVENTLKSDTVVNDIVNASKILTAKQNMSVGNINCQGYKFGELDQTVLVDVFSMQTANIVTSALTENQSYTEMVTKVDQRVKTIATGGTIFIIAIVIIAVLFIRESSKHVGKINSKNMAKMAQMAKYAA